MDSPATTPLSSPIQSTLESPAPTKISWFVWVIIILVLAFLGFNIFTYLAKGTQGVSNFFGHMIENTGIFIFKIIEYISDFFKRLFGGSSPQTSSPPKTTSEKAPVGKDETTSATPASVSSTLPQQNPVNEQSLSQSLNQSLKQQSMMKPTTRSDQENYYADDSHSSIQSSKPSAKSGWCFIGEDRGFRSCIRVNKDDKCMSGDIFPSQEICINPTLRA
jgi:hypothetical protein